MNKLSISIVLMFLLNSLVFGQSTSPSSSSERTFHVQGTIHSPWDSMLKGLVVARSKLTFAGEQPVETVTSDGKDTYVRVPKTEVTFYGSQVVRTLVVNDSGFYEGELPVGSYRMNAHGPQIGSQKLTDYVRLFKVSAAKDVVLNGSLYMLQGNCDAVVGDDPDGQKWKDICGGEDSLTVPSKDATQLRLYIRFPTRKLTRNEIEYDRDNFSWPGVPILLSYNLFSLQADHVLYDTANWTIHASGNVMTEDGVGGKNQSDAVTIKIVGEDVIVQK